MSDFMRDTSKISLRIVKSPDETEETDIQSSVKTESTKKSLPTKVKHPEKIEVKLPKQSIGMSMESFQPSKVPN